ncbi:MAG: hypothetical protein WD176_02895, partial [Pirellulales bacterium]
DKSIRKDTVRLPAAYYQAGVSEFWLADARSDELIFVIHRRGATAFEPVAIDDDGFQSSGVMGCRYRLARQHDEGGHWEYDLQEREAN